MLPPGAAPRLALWAEREPDAVARGARQRAVLDALRSGPLPLAALRAATGAGADVVRRLAEAGALRVYEPSPPAELQVGTGPQLTAAQAAAVARIAEAMETAEPLLLHGVTGAGKTEVFLHAIARCLEAGRGAIVLVPEIALAPQTAGRITARFGGRVAVLHSALAPGARAAEHRRIRRGEARVVVGPRSAIFAPLDEIGLIVVDEEHDGAYKQESDPRYDARAVALLRAREHGAAVVYATATPRAESWHALERVSLPERVGGRLPPVTVVDLCRDGGYPLSRPVNDDLAAIERDGGRAVLLLNRRGEAPALHCRGCGSTFTCGDCDVALTLHARPPRLECHHCGRRRPVPRRCPGCGAVDVTRLGAGTERLEAVLEERFPELEVLRLDADVTSRQGALEAVLDRFARSERAVLVGTQLVAKGHDFPDVRLAAAIDADVGLALADFRAEERTFSLLVQLAGRAGREGTGGRVLLQSWTPESRVVRLAARHAVDEFMDGEVARRATFGYPPHARLVRVLVAAPDVGAPERVLAGLAAHARAALPGDEVLGPAALFRVRRQERAHLLVRTTAARRAARVLRDLVRDATPALRRANGTAVVDVDPQSLT